MLKELEINFGTKRSAQDIATQLKLIAVAIRIGQNANEFVYDFGLSLFGKNLNSIWKQILTSEIKPNTLFCERTMCIVFPVFTKSIVPLYNCTLGGSFCFLFYVPSVKVSNISHYQNCECSDNMTFHSYE